MFRSNLNGQEAWPNSLRWYLPQNIPKNLFKDREERLIASDCTHEEKMNFEGFLKNTSMATSHGLWRFYLITLTVTISCRFLFRSTQ